MDAFGERRDDILRKAAEAGYGHGSHVIHRDIANRSVGVDDRQSGVGQCGGCGRGAHGRHFPRLSQGLERVARQAQPQIDGFQPTERCACGLCHEDQGKRPVERRQVRVGGKHRAASEQVGMGNSQLVTDELQRVGETRVNVPVTRALACGRVDCALKGVGDRHQDLSGRVACHIPRAVVHAARHE